MKDEEIGVIAKFVAGNWPSAPMSAETIEVFRLELDTLDFTATLAVLREEFAPAPFPPTPMQLRDAVLRRSNGQITYEQAMSELLDKIASVGYASPEPRWSHPSIGQMVRLRGGWTEVCASTPARAAVDAYGQGTFNTWAAQFRDEYRLVAARAERQATHAALAGPDDQGEIEMPDLRYRDDEANG